MIRRPVRLLLYGAAVLIFALILGRIAARLYTDALWFQSVGYGSVFWTRLAVNAVVRTVTAGIAAALVGLNLWVVTRQIGPVHVRRRYGNLEIAEKIPAGYVAALVVAVAVLAGWWLSGLQFDPATMLHTAAWTRRGSWGLADPVFGRDLTFYVFTLPILYRGIDLLLLGLIWSMALVALGYVLIGAVRWRDSRLEADDNARMHFVVLVAGLIVVVGLRYWIGRYGLLLDGTGFGGALGYTDVHARLPAQRALAGLSLLTAAALLYGARRGTWLPPLVAVGALLLAAVLAGRLYPSMVQKFRVEPNQLAREAPYIRWNLDFTRSAYGLGSVRRMPLPFQPRHLPPDEALHPWLQRLPLWDPAPLRANFNERQARYRYYQFPDVDFDRYGPRGAAEQVAIAVREFDPQGLPEDARTWQTLHLNPKYLRGAGAVVAPAARAQEGEPELWLHNVEPVKRDSALAPPEFELGAPEVYFGETSLGYAILTAGRSGLRGEPGVAFPDGIRLGSFLRRVAFAWRFGEQNLLLAGGITDQSRLVFRRSVGERVRAIVPFLHWDGDAYPVIHRGRIIWMVDGYTVTANYPLARALLIENIGRVRYLRNSVKATVDALTGDVVFYALPTRDPLLDAYRAIFPGLIRPLDQMPEELRSHLRYPALLFHAQADVLEEYHVEQPEAFYAGQDFWQLPRGTGADGADRPYRPTYVIGRLPRESETEFLLVTPFIARERQNMTALLVARNDPPDYGDLVLLELPRDRQIPGPGQVQRFIEQDPVIAPQLTLWRNRGSGVEFGHLRIVPFDNSLLYAQPLYLSAQQGNPLPQLQRAIVSDGGNVAMAPTLAEAVRALGTPPGEQAAAVTGSAPAAPASATDWPREALQLLEEAERRLRNGDWAGFGENWTRLQRLLRELAGAPD